MAALPAPEEGKLLSEALNTVKIQVQQMKRHLVRPQFCSCCIARPYHLLGAGRINGCAQECELDAGRATHVIAVAQTVLRTLCVRVSIS